MCFCGTALGVFLSRGTDPLLSLPAHGKRPCRGPARPLVGRGDRLCRCIAAKSSGDRNPLRLSWKHSGSPDRRICLPAVQKPRCGPRRTSGDDSGGGSPCRSRTRTGHGTIRRATLPFRGLSSQQPSRLSDRHGSSRRARKNAPSRLPAKRPFLIIFREKGYYLPSFSQVEKLSPSV